MYTIVMTAPDDQTTTWFNTAEEAMKAANRLRTLKVESFVIQDQGGEPVTERQLAMMVMEARLQAKGMGTALL